MTSTFLKAIIRIRVEVKKHSPSAALGKLVPKNLDIRDFGEWEDHMTLSSGSCAEFNRLAQRIERDLGVRVKWATGKNNHISVTLS